MKYPVTIYHLGLGSNEGRPRRNLARARRLLEAEGIAVRKASAVYRTEPVGFSDQPWFLNQVLEAATDLSPWEVLAAAKRIEAAMGRRPARRYGPRVIDIDILLAGPTVLRTTALTVPHPRLADRNFVLVPLAEIAPRAKHPVLRATIRSLLARSRDRSGVEKVPPSSRPAPKPRR